MTSEGFGGGVGGGVFCNNNWPLLYITCVICGFINMWFVIKSWGDHFLYIFPNIYCHPVIHIEQSLRGYCYMCHPIWTLRYTFGVRLIVKWFWYTFPDLDISASVCAFLVSWMFNSGRLITTWLWCVCIGVMSVDCVFLRCLHGCQY